MALEAISFRESVSKFRVDIIGPCTLIGGFTALCLLVFLGIGHWSLGAMEAINPASGCVYGAVAGFLINFIVSVIAYLKERNFQGRIIHKPKPNSTEGEL